MPVSKVTYTESTSVMGMAACSNVIYEWIISIDDFDSWVYLGNTYTPAHIITGFHNSPQLGSVGCTLIGTRDGVAIRGSSTDGSGGAHTNETWDQAAFGVFTLAVGYDKSNPWNMEGGGVYPTHSPAFIITGMPAVPTDNLSLLVGYSGPQNFVVTYANSTDQLSVDSLWRAADGQFHYRASVLGLEQTVYSENMQPDSTVVCVGNLVEGESPSTDSFTFIGATGE